MLTLPLPRDEEKAVPGTSLCRWPDQTQELTVKVCKQSHIDFIHNSEPGAGALDSDSDSIVKEQHSVDFFLENCG